MNTRGGLYVWVRRADGRTNITLTCATHRTWEVGWSITEYDGPNALKLACDHLLRLASRERLSCECAKEALFV